MVVEANKRELKSFAFLSLLLSRFGVNNGGFCWIKKMLRKL